MRYVLLLCITVPIVLLGLLNIITRYKMHKIDGYQFTRQLAVWLILFILLVSSYPLYNILIGRPLLDSSDLSVFDIVEIAAILVLIYITNDQRHKIEAAERRTRDLHQELSIILSKDDKKN